MPELGYELNFFHKDVRSIRRNTILKLCADYAKKFVINALELWQNQSWTLYHDNALAYTWMLVCEFFTKNKTVIKRQPPYSLDLATTDVFLFLKLKTPMKRNCFAAIQEIKEKSQQKLLAIPKREYWKCCEDLKNTLVCALIR